MAFPTVRSTSSGLDQSGAGVTSFNVTLPATVENNDLLLVYLDIDAPGDETITFPSGDGWVQQFDESYAGVFRGVCYKKIADGTEDAEVITVTLSASEQGVYICHAIQDWSGDLDDVESASSQSFGTAPDSPSLSPAWGADDTFWVSLWQNHNSSNVTSYPANYLDNQLAKDNNAYCNECIATRELNAASENPGAWTSDTTRQNIASTLAVRPASTSTTIEVPVGPVW